MGEKIIPVLETKGVTKQFAGIPANDCIDFRLQKGETHALLGENGAGKSTLMNIISGMVRPDKGQIFLNGRLARIRNTVDAIRLGIHMVHQHFMLIPVFTVMENIVLGDEITRWSVLDMQRARKKITGLMEAYALSIDPDARVENLSIGMQQRVEIMKALYREAGILILDEPTAVLTPQEVDTLFTVMRRLTAKGVSIVFITHKLKEVMAYADRITVIRQGRVVETTRPSVTDEYRLAEMMVGRKVPMQIEKSPARPGKVMVAVNGLTVLDERRVPAVKEVSLDIRTREIVGLAGVQGNGQTELAAALAGLRPITSGTVCFDGQSLLPKHPRKMIERGMSHIPEDRLKHGLVAAYSIADNQVMCTYYKPPFARCLLRHTKAVMANSKALMDQYDIRAAGPPVPAGMLSGGNQQKVIVSRELSREVKFLLANQPTRGLDVGSISYIHRKIMDMRDEGAAVLLISSELDEILSLSDVIAVMFQGRILATLPAERASKEVLGLLSAGIKPGE